MARQQWYDWALWIWQRFQQLVGALLVAVPAGIFLYCLTQGDLPGDFESDIQVEKNDHRTIDHFHIAAAIGICHLLPGDPSTWSIDWRRTLGITDKMSPPVPGLTRVDVQQHEHELTSYERSALYHSERISKERERFLYEAEQRQDRARRNQLRILCLSAAAAFLVSLRALAGNKDEDVAFRSLMKGALLPISVLALLMPVLATAVSGITTFDGDPNVVVRNVRTVAQLEQLHGRIAEDVTSDPYLCRMTWATNVRPSADGLISPFGRAPKLDPALLGKCVDDRMSRTMAWTQRHEQILNDAMPSLAHPGDLPRPAGKPQPAPAPENGPATLVTRPKPSEPSKLAEASKLAEPPGDFCRETFAQWSAAVGSPASPQSQQTMNNSAELKPKPL